MMILNLLAACQSAKDALTLKKKNSADEFLVEKKNPLVLPPNFNDLPTPKDVAETNQIENIEDEIEDLLSSIKDDNEEAVDPSSTSDTENFVLEKIQD